MLIKGLALVERLGTWGKDRRATVSCDSQEESWARKRATNAVIYGALKVLFSIKHMSGVPQEPTREREQSLPE